MVLIPADSLLVEPRPDMLDPCKSAQDEVITQSAAGLSGARTTYFATGDEVELVDSYQAWVSNPVYVVLEDKLNPGTYKCFRGAKRGDPFYYHKTISRFEQVQDNIKDLDIQFGATRTQAVFVALTYAEQREENWETVSQDFNRFMSRIRKRYGEVYAVRIWESHESGLVHVHVVLLFKSRRFKTFKDRGGLIRLTRKDELAECWTRGFSDWQGIYDLEGALDYIKRDMTKFLNHENENDVRDLAKLWIYRKRTFSVSKKLSTPRLDGAMSYSNPPMYQHTLDGWMFLIDPHNWRLVCVVGAMIDLTKVKITNVRELASSGWIHRYAVTCSPD
ncbi:unnamed protein product [marine sediment metagenome]|uniref:Replication-associated protein ORF2/G2P domain-containing protein n=1 Tax=marine sediment metagenome TaxID=412755 RepID=X1QL15_9ZZZZ